MQGENVYRVFNVYRGVLCSERQSVPASLSPGWPVESVSGHQGARE